MVSLSVVLDSLCLFLNGALHFIEYSDYHKFILSFDVNDERFYEILLPQNNLDGFDGVYRQCLTVFKGLLALIVFGCTLPLD